MDFEQHLKGASSGLQEAMGSAVVRVTPVDDEHLPDLVVNRQTAPTAPTAPIAPTAPTGPPAPEEDEKNKSRPGRGKPRCRKERLEQEERNRLAALQKPYKKSDQEGRMKTRQTAQERKDEEERLRKEWEAGIKQRATDRQNQKQIAIELKLVKQAEAHKQKQKLDFQEKQRLQKIADKAVEEEKRRRNETPAETEARQLRERSKREKWNKERIKEDALLMKQWTKSHRVDDEAAKTAKYAKEREVRSRISQTTGGDNDDDDNNDNDADD